MPTPDRLNISSRSRASASSSPACAFRRVTSDSTAVNSIAADAGPARRTDSAYQRVAAPASTPSPSPTPPHSNSVS